MTLRMITEICATVALVNLFWVIAYIVKQVNKYK